MIYNKNTQSKEYLFSFETQDEISDDPTSSSGGVIAVTSDIPRKHAINGGRDDYPLTTEKSSYSRLISSLLKRVDNQSKVYIYCFRSVLLLWLKYLNKSVASF